MGRRGDQVAIHQRDIILPPITLYMEAREGGFRHPLLAILDSGVDCYYSTFTHDLPNQLSDVLLAKGVPLVCL